MGNGAESAYHSFILERTIDLDFALTFFYWKCECNKIISVFCRQKKKNWKLIISEKFQSSGEHTLESKGYKHDHFVRRENSSLGVSGSSLRRSSVVSVQQMYGSNGAMKQGGSMTTLTGAGVTATMQQGNWCHPAGPLGFRLSTPARVRLYCLAKWDTRTRLTAATQTTCLRVKKTSGSSSSR